MRVNLIKKQTITDFISKNSNSKAALERWMSTLKTVDWSAPEDILKTFSYADLICEGKRVVFNIGGNNFRIIASYVFGMRTKDMALYINFIGSHAAYSKLCKANMQCQISNY